MIRMASVRISEQAKLYVSDVLEKGWLSRHYFIPKFEEAVAIRHGAKHGILVNSGTDALRISLAVLKETEGLKDGDKVIVPALTFVATVNAILQNNLKPRFCDVELKTGNWNGKTTYFDSTDERAIVPVHLFGLPAFVPTNERNLKIVEDSCETFGVHYMQGDLMCFSFYVSHHISAGVGGMILTNSDRYAALARSFMNHGRIDDGSHFEFGRSGYSSRITEMEAALGLAALDEFDEDLLIRRKLAEIYQNELDGELPSNHSWMFYPMLLDMASRKELILCLKMNGIESREAMPLINQPVFKDLYEPGSCPNAEIWTKNGILLPLHPQMTEADARFVAQTVKGFLLKHLSPV